MEIVVKLGICGNRTDVALLADLPARSPREGAPRLSTAPPPQSRAGPASAIQGVFNGILFRLL